MFDPDKLYTKAMSAAEDYADKDEAAGNLEDALDALRGDIMAELKARGEPVTVLKDYARKDPRYTQTAKSWREARKQALIARMKYDQICRYQDNERTNEVTTRRLAT